jgi:hypothetical protein
MDTEICQTKIIAHISGLTDHTKQELYTLFNKSTIKNNIDIIDIDIITKKIIEDDNMNILFAKSETYLQKSKDCNISKISNKMYLNKVKDLEKKIFQYWKVKIEYFINKLIKNSRNNVILIGYLSFFRNHNLRINLNIIPKFFIKVNYDQHAKQIIKSNLINSQDDIINGNFDLNYLSPDFLIKKRILLQNIYSKINYSIMSVGSIFNTIELYTQTELPDILYYASFTKYDKKIPIINGIGSIIAYTNDWLALCSISNTQTKSIEKGIKDNKPYIKLTKSSDSTKDDVKILSKSGYIYEITDTENFLPFPSKNNLYKYFTVKPIKINRVMHIDNILTKIKSLNINIIYI